MSNYVKTVNFAAKDALLHGDPNKVVKGTEIDTEFNNLATMSATKADNSSVLITGGSINGTVIGNVTPSTGAFTTVTTPLITTSASDLQLGTNGAFYWNILQNAFGGMPQGAFYPSVDNARSLGGPSNRLTSGYFSTSVVAPLVTSASGVLTLIPGTGASGVSVGTPASAATIGTRIGGGSNELAQIGVQNGTGILSFYVGFGGLSGSGGYFLSGATSAILDSGSAGQVLLRTNNGTTHILLNDTGSADRPLNISAGLSSVRSLMTSVGSLVNWSFITNGGAFNFYSGGGETFQQVQINHTASANRALTFTGSNGGNPTISTTAGNLAVTPDTLFSHSIAVAATAPTSGAGDIRLQQTGTISFLTSGSLNGSLAEAATVNAINDIVRIGSSSAGLTSSNGVILQARSKAGAPTTSDLPASTWCVWRDTTGSTTKLYYNNAGTIQSVALV